MPRREVLVRYLPRREKKTPRLHKLTGGFLRERTLVVQGGATTLFDITDSLTKVKRKKNIDATKYGV